MRLRFLFLLGFLFPSAMLLGQSIMSIDALYVSPSQPTTADPIHVIYEVTYNSTHGSRINYDTARTANRIQLNICHTAGMGAAITTFRDTVTYAPFAAGTYDLLFELKLGLPDPNFPSGCYLTTDTLHAALSLTVGQVTSVALPFSESSVRLYPNPTDGRPFTVESTAALQRIQVYNALGTLVYERRLEGVYQQAVEGVDWPRGLYLVVVKTATGYSRQVLAQQ